MKKGFLKSVAALLASTGLAVAQTPAPPSQKPILEPPSAKTPVPAAQPTLVTAPSQQVITVMPEGPSVAEDEANAFSGPFPPPSNTAPPSEPNEPGTFGPFTAPGRFWINGEYLLWQMRNAPIPVPLVSTGTTSSVGVLDRTGTSLVYGNTNTNFDLESGGKLTAGFWFDCRQALGFEASGFGINQSTSSFRTISDPTGSPILVRPVINAITVMEAASPLALPGLMQGGFDAASTSQVYGAEANLLGSLCRSDWYCVDMLTGFRYVGLSEELNLNSFSSPLMIGGGGAFNGQSVGFPNTVLVNDLFETRNDFYGGQIGARAEFRRCNVVLGLEGKLAIGNTHESVNINGRTQLLNGSGAVTGTLPGGLLAVASNSGLATRDEFSLMPQGSVKLGYRLGDHIGFFASYSYLYWYHVARPGDQLNRTVNPTLVPSNLAFGTPLGPVQPAANFQRTDIWVQGLGLGLELRY